MFDLDGTLIHSAPEIAFAANQMLADLGQSTLPYQQIESYIGEGAQVLIKRCISGKRDVEPEPTLFEEGQRLFYHYYTINAQESKPFEGVLDGLRALENKGLKLACVTNKPEKFTLPLLKNSGLDIFFDIVVSGDTLANKKPDPIQLHHICAKFNIMETDAMLVGDSATDIAAAHAAGCFIVTVPYGYNQGQPIDDRLVDATISDLTELVTLLA